METHPKLLGTAKTCWVDVQKLKSMAEQTRKHSFILVSQPSKAEQNGYKRNKNEKEIKKKETKITKTLECLCKWQIIYKKVLYDKIF